MTVGSKESSAEMIYVAKKLQTVRAWKYEKDADVPLWVARKCHDLGDCKLTANTIVGPIPIDVGDYVAVIDEESGAVTVVNGAEFEKEYEPAPSSEASTNTPTTDICHRAISNAMTVVAHWNEFGPENGFEEDVSRLGKVLDEYWGQRNG